MLANMFIYGLVNSAILMLTALGFSLIFGLSGVANFAHGGIYLLSGYICWILLNYLGIPLLFATILTIILVGIFGGLLYRLVVMPVRGIILSEVIATFAVGLAIVEFFRWAGFVTYDFTLPVYIQGSIEIAGVYVDYQRLLIIAIGLVLTFILWLFTHYTKAGLALRGMSQEEYTALSLGIDSDWAATLSMALGAALTAVAAMSIIPLGIITIDMGYEVLLVSLAVTVVGGMESTKGLVVASFLIGYAMVITSSYFSSQWSHVVYMSAIVLVLVFRPSGLFGKLKEMEERV